MKTTKLNLILTAILTTIIMASCSVLKDLEYEVKEDPIEMHGDEVTVKIDGKFIEKGLNKKAFVTLTPVLVNEAGDELAFDSKSFKGEKAAGNGEVVKKDGHSFSYTSTRPYDPKFENAELKVRYVATKGGNEKVNDITPKIADATIVTPLWIQNDDKVAMGEDELVRSFDKSTKAVVNYDKGRFVVKKNETTDEDVVALQNWFLASSANPKIVVNNIEIMSYASPEGEIERNQNLAADRAESANKMLMNMNKKMNLGIDPVMVKKSPKGEDWAGLKELIRNSDHEDKNIIISVAEMENDPTKREAEIKTLATTYKFLDNDIFPQLRRSQIMVNYTENGLTDDELKAAAANNPQSLTVEEMLFTANKLTTDDDTKLAIYREAIKKDASDWRGYTNAGVILYKKGNNTEANAMFTKAYAAEKNAITSNNMGVVKRQAGEISEALELFNSASGTGATANYNKGLINIKKGEYSSAISNMGDNATFNKALAQVLNKDFNTALTTLQNSTDNNSANGLYLKAIIAARTGNDADVVSNLKNAIAKDASLKAKAMKDREFIKYLNNGAFSAL